MVAYLRTPRAAGRWNGVLRFQGVCEHPRSARERKQAAYANGLRKRATLSAGTEVWLTGGREGEWQNGQLHTEIAIKMIKHLFQLSLAICNLLLIRASVGTLAHEEIVFDLEIEGLLQR